MRNQFNSDAQRNSKVRPCVARKPPCREIFFVSDILSLSLYAYEVIANIIMFFTHFSLGNQFAIRKIQQSWSCFSYSVHGVQD
ncbi:uncharacterized protein BDZ99DRAFT_176385 [Mytilinidion resinicola]|uniref:Uncharacterized protein n=1 Tax=Mytilinidion resinicola TaxID=574789 RepID=A0A6A6Y3P7_9PEZI|nr:uncharacterized protein BDZ99DRAFT_176385 [Mytilinidion resinicola]KAF2802855.1 hypothetical protein BDZ99DRAFT_176385 [Mytilinidion resinicola]